jgi:hypothetical protein
MTWAAPVGTTTELDIVLEGDRLRIADATEFWRAHDHVADDVFEGPLRAGESVLLPGRERLPIGAGETAQVIENPGGHDVVRFYLKDYTSNLSVHGPGCNGTTARSRPRPGRTCARVPPNA